MKQLATKASGHLAPGDVIEVTVGDVAHGGWCVARPAAPVSAALASAPPASPPPASAAPAPAPAALGTTAPGTAAAGHLVLFVRHALPGELVRARVTSTTAKFARADAVEVLRAAPERVSPPCPHAKPGGCGGCDWQHATSAAQRDLKARVIRQQLNRIAGIDREVTVEHLPCDADEPGEDGMLGWRTRVKFAVGKNGEAGLRRHRSHEIVAISDCLIAHPLVRAAGVTRQAWPGARWVDVAVAPATGQRAVMTHDDRRRMPPPGPRGGLGHRGPGPSGSGVSPGDRAPGEADRPPRPVPLTQRAAGRDWRVTADGFWQVHPSAANVLADAVLSGLRPEPGEIALDLFCGAGLFAGVLARAVGPDGTVIGVERDAAAVRDARYNLRSTPWARVHRGDACEVLARIGAHGASIAVADPPRTGLDRALIDILCDRPEPRRLRRIAYVSCDPATLARDIAAFARNGWSLADLRAFDAFPMTHHVECLAIVEPAGD